MSNGTGSRFVIVAPLVGAWIEISVFSLQLLNKSVAPLVGAWIEITWLSLRFTAAFVAPLVGAWIEITSTLGFNMPLSCRSSCRSVD